MADHDHRNLKYFDSLASQYNVHPWQKHITAETTREIHENFDFIFPNERSGKVRRDLRLLDYASGPGMMTQALAARCSDAVAIDISPSMIDAYKKQMESCPMPGLKTSAVVGNLFTVEPTHEFDDPSFFNFDIAAVGLGFHHFKAFDLCMKRLAERVRPGGIVFIVDFCLDGGDLPQAAGITSNGFSEQGMKEIFEGAGLTQVGYHRIQGEFNMHMHGNEVKKSIFLGRAEKPA